MSAEDVQNLQVLPLTGVGYVCRLCMNIEHIVRLVFIPLSRLCRNCAPLSAEMITTISIYIILEKGFVKEYDLIKHMSTHTSDKPFECEHCGLAFKCHSNFKQHQILRHRVGTPEERYVCMYQVSLV